MQSSKQPFFAPATAPPHVSYVGVAPYNFNSVANGSAPAPLLAPPHRLPQAPHQMSSAAVTHFDRRMQELYKQQQQFRRPRHQSPAQPTQPFMFASPNALMRYQQRLNPSASHRKLSEPASEKAERARRGKERQKEDQERAKRYAALQDPNADFHSYNDRLEYFPLRRGEHPNPYLLGLLANQPLPEKVTSDQALGIQYAKEHWYNYWELKDLDAVVGLAKEAIERKMKARAQLNDNGGTMNRP